MMDKIQALAYLDANFTENNDSYLSFIAKCIRDEKCAFFLGAGVCVPVGLPAWPQLLRELYLNLALILRKEEEKPDLLTVVSETIAQKTSILADINAIEAGEYIHTILDIQVRKHFASFAAGGSHAEYAINALMVAVMRGLLRDFYCRALEKDKEKDKSGEKTVSWDVLECICSFLTGTPLVSKVITYNFDDLLEYAYFCRLGLNGLVSHGIDDSIQDNDDKVHLYHTHGRAGFLAQEYYDASDDDKHGLIFAENRYFQIEREQYSRTNITQSYFLNSHCCFFMGLSMQDYSIRRILRGAPSTYVKEHSKHLMNRIVGEQYKIPGGMKPRDVRIILYPINAMMNSIPGLGEEDRKKGDVSDEAKKLLNMMLHPQAAYMVKHGLFPIYTTHEDIPVYLTMLLSKLGKSRVKPCAIE